jgi:hypothetical protein
MEELLHHGIESNKARFSGRELLVLCDTVEISLKSRKDKIRDPEKMGVISNNRDPGFHSHVSLALDLSSGHALGISDALVWNRPPNHVAKKDRVKNTSRPAEEKESMKWLMGAANSKEVLTEAQHKTFIFDSEGDTYQVWEEVPDESTDLITRIRADRRIEEGPGKLYAFIDQQAIQGSFELPIRSNPDKNRKKRTAKLDVKFGRVKIKSPRNKPNKQSLGLFYIEAKESPQTVPEGEQPIHWRLFTTIAIDSFEQACQILTYYSLRWMIEQLFRVLKRQGFNIELTELEYTHSIMKLFILSLFAAIKVMQMLLARDKQDGQPLNEVFTHDEIECLELLKKKYEGKTQKQKNPFPKDQLSWAAWIIARLGGWKGYAKRRPPGPITMKRGLDRFYTILEGWTLWKSELDM